MFKARVFDARVREACSNREASLFESRACSNAHAARARARKKGGVEEDVDFKEVEFAGSGALRSVLLIGARRIKKSDSPVGMTARFLLSGLVASGVKPPEV